MRKLAVAVTLVLLSSLIGGTAEAGRRRYNTRIVLSVITPGPGVAGTLDGNARCLGGRLVTVTRNSNVEGTFPTSPSGQFIASTPVSDGDVFMASVPKKAKKRYVCSAAATEPITVYTLTVQAPATIGGVPPKITGGSSIDCAPDCTELFLAGTSVRLIAQSNENHVFVSWSSGPCAPTSTNPCDFVVNADVTAAATYGVP